MIKTQISHAELARDPFGCAERLALSGVPVEGSAEAPCAGSWSRCVTCTDPGNDTDDFKHPEARLVVASPAETGR